MEIGKAPVEADYTTFASWKQARNAWDSQRRELQRSEANVSSKARCGSSSSGIGSRRGGKAVVWIRGSTAGNQHERVPWALQTTTWATSAHAAIQEAWPPVQAATGSCRARRKRLLQVEVWVAYGTALTYSLARRHAVSVGSLRAQLACIRIRGFR